MTARTLLCALIAAGVGASAAHAWSVQAPREPLPGQGVICSMAILNAMAEVGRRCFPGQNPEFQAELARATALIDDYVLRNSDWTPADLERFKREQAHVGDTEAFPSLCHDRDVVGMYRQMAASDLAQTRADTDRMLARPGRPTWGDCL